MTQNNHYHFHIYGQDGKEKEVSAMNHLGKYKAKELAEQEKHAEVIKPQTAMEALLDMYDLYDDDDEEYDDLYDYDEFNGRRLVEKYYDEEDEEYDDLYDDDDEEYEEYDEDEYADDFEQAYQDYINAFYGVFDEDEDDFEAGYHWNNDYQTGLIESYVFLCQ